jgi:hypothetical protein
MRKTNLFTIAAAVILAGVGAASTGHHSPWQSYRSFTL